jgi:hypothetical protein
LLISALRDGTFVIALVGFDVLFAALRVLLADLLTVKRCKKSALCRGDWLLSITFAAETDNMNGINNNDYED